MFLKQKLCERARVFGGERKAAAAVASKIISHCWECYNLDYISCSLKVYFPINSISISSS